MMRMRMRMRMRMMRADVAMRKERLSQGERSSIFQTRMVG